MLKRSSVIEKGEINVSISLPRDLFRRPNGPDLHVLVWRFFCGKLK